MGGHLKLWKDVGIWGFNSRIWFSAAEIALTSSYNAAFYSAVLPIYLFLGHSFNLYISDSERFPLFISPLVKNFLLLFISQSISFCLCVCVFSAVTFRIPRQLAHPFPSLSLHPFTPPYRTWPLPCLWATFPSNSLHSLLTFPPSFIYWNMLMVQTQVDRIFFCYTGCKK